MDAPLMENGDNGWIGEWYSSFVDFGTPEENVRSSSPIRVALIERQNTDICTPNLKGILGIDFGGNNL